MTLPVLHFDFIVEEIRRAPIDQNWHLFPYRLRETGQVFEIEVRKVWGKTYYSFDGGDTQARTKREAFRLASPSAIAEFAGPR